MPWIVKGLDRETGDQKILRFDVVSEDEAVRKAGEAGYAVESVKHIPPKEPVTAPKPKKKKADEWVSPKVGEDPRITTGEGVGVAIFAIFGFILTIGGAGLLIGGVEARFRPDNAYGATANALENIQALAAIAAGALCFIVTSLIQLRGVIRFAVAGAVKQMKREGDG